MSHFLRVEINVTQQSANKKLAGKGRDGKEEDDDSDLSTVAESVNNGSSSLASAFGGSRKGHNKSPSSTKRK